MNITLKNSLKNNLIILLSAFGKYILLLLFPLLKIYIDNTYIIIIITTLIAIDVLPALYLQIEYNIVSSSCVIHLVDDYKFVINKLSKEVRNINFDDIELIILYPSSTEVISSIINPKYAVDSYHYMRIITKSKEEFIITNMMYPNLFKLFDYFKNIKNLKVRTVNDFFNSVYKNKRF